MHVEGKYFLVSYRDAPNTDFICEYDGDVRIRVSRMEKGKLELMSQKLISGTADKCILVFENISNRLIEEQEEVVKAVSWYKSKIGINLASLIYL